MNISPSCEQERTSVNAVGRSPHREALGKGATRPVASHLGRPAPGKKIQCCTLPSRQSGISTLRCALPSWKSGKTIRQCTVTRGHSGKTVQHCALPRRRFEIRTWHRTLASYSKRISTRSCALLSLEFHRVERDFRRACIDFSIRSSKLSGADQNIATPDFDSEDSR